MDKFSPEVRSRMMSRVKAKNTKPELLLRKFLFSKGYRYRLHVKYLPGKPDIVLPKYKTVIFVNGCFWHGHEACKKAALPQSNKEFWEKKISSNMKRDSLHYESLESSGWKVIVIWSCQIPEILKSQQISSLNIPHK